jgi:hypothetical protein
MKSAGDYQIDAALDALSQIDDDAVERYKNLLSNEYYGDFAAEFEAVEIKGKSISMGTVTGSMGFEFAVAFIDFLGPYCEEIIGNFQHDEEPPEDEPWPIKLTYEEGKVYANDIETAVVTSPFDSFEDDEYEWDEEPKLDKGVLAPIYQICQKASEENNLSELVSIYSSLLDPILAIGTEYEASLNEELPERDWLEAINGLHNLKAVKDNHQAITYFKNKMYENISIMADCEYFGSILSEYKKVLIVAILIFELHEESCDESFEESFGYVEDQDEFNGLYELVGLQTLFEE